MLLFSGSVRVQCQRDYPLGIGNSLVSTSLWEFLEHLRVPSNAPRPHLHARACMHHGTVAHRSKGLGSGAYFRHGWWSQRKVPRPNGLALPHALCFTFIGGLCSRSCIDCCIASAVGARSAAKILGRKYEDLSCSLTMSHCHSMIHFIVRVLSLGVIGTCLYLGHGVCSLSMVIPVHRPSASLPHSGMKWQTYMCHT